MSRRLAVKVAPKASQQRASGIEEHKTANEANMETKKRKREAAEETASPVKERVR